MMKTWKAGPWQFGFAVQRNREQGRLWLSPLLIARTFWVGGFMSVASLVLAWGWDEDEPLCLAPTTSLRRKVKPTSHGDMLDEHLSFRWLGFNVALHLFTEVFPHAPLDDEQEDEDESETEVSHG